MTFDAFTKAEKAGWHARAADYGAHTALATLQIVPAMLDALRLKPGQRLLDVACGPGYVAGAAAALEVSTQGVDYADGMVDEARSRFPGLQFDVADAEDLPMADRTFDAVACNMGLFHMGDPQQAMNEAARVLRPGGRFCFSQWTAPDASPLYERLFAALSAEADMTRADPAPNAYALSDDETTTAMMHTAGFISVTARLLDTELIATGPDFFDFFMKFGVRVPLIVAAQTDAVQQKLRDRINADMTPFRTETGYAVPMPSIIFTGTRQ